MTISTRCVICKTPARRRLLELGWNDGMSCPELASSIGDAVSPATILKHLKEHADGDARVRAVETRPVGTPRERIIALQEMQLNEVERRIALAKQRAAQLNAALDEMAEKGIEGADTAVRHDWSEFYDLLDKGNQAAISSILKTQGLEDRREKATADLKLGLFDAMARAGLAPKSLVGGSVAPQVLPGEDEDHDDADA